MGRQIGINTEEDEHSIESDRKQPELSARELKVKKYAQAFHTYFLKQRNALQIEKALENSDSEMDEHMDEQVDKMIGEREKIEEERRLQKREAKRLATKKLLIKPGVS